MFKKAVFVAAPLAVLGGFAVASTAQAATNTTVSATKASVDAFTGITVTSSAATASSNGLTNVSPTTTSLSLSATGTNLGSKLTWSVGAKVNSPSDVGIPQLSGSATSASETVKVTDGFAVALETVTVVPTKATTPSSTGAVDITVTPDIVGLNAPSNANGEVTFVGTGIGAVSYAYAGSPEPAGIAFDTTTGVLSSGTAVRGTYPAQAVAAADNAGAVAVETFTAVVKDVTTTPAPTPSPTSSNPHLYAGHVITVNNNDAEIGWHFGPGVTCALTRTFGYGFSAADGSPHQGFTCYNPAENAPGTDVGYWAGLAAGHGYDIQLIPANPTTRQPLPDAQTGWIYIHTTS